MAKTLFLVIVLLIVGFGVIGGLLWIASLFERLDDEDYQIRRRAAREYRDARDDLRHEKTMAEVREDEKAKAKAAARRSRRK